MIPRAPKMTLREYPFTRRYLFQAWQHISSAYIRVWAFMAAEEADVPEQQKLKEAYAALEQAAELLEEISQLKFAKTIKELEVYK